MRKSLFTLIIAWLIQLGAFAQMDVTNLITNPSFEDGLTGWVNNGFQTQSNSSFSMKVGTYYCEKWITGSENLPDASINQIVTLDNGNYTLKAVAGFNDADGPASGLFIIANADSVEVSDKKEYTIDTEVTDGSLNIQVVLSNANGNYAYFDHFVLLKKVDYTIVNISDTVFAFDEEINTKTFTIDASNLSEDITITAPTGFSVDVASIGKDITESTTVTITFDAQATATGDIVISTAGSDDQIIKLDGQVMGYERIFVPYYPSGNLMSNPYFNTLDNMGGWGHREITTDPEYVYAGGGSYYMNGTAACWPDGASLDYTIPSQLESNTMYILRAMVRTMDGSIAFGIKNAAIEGQNGSNVKQYLIPHTDGEWKQVSIAFRTGEITAATQEIFFNNCELNPTGTQVYLDNYELYKLLPSSDATLNELSIEDYPLDATFDPSNDTYEILVPYGTPSVDITAIPSDLGSTIAYFDGAGTEYGEDGIISFSEDGIDVEILVTSSDGTEATYYLAIYVEDPKKDGTLNGIDLSVSAIDPFFNKDSASYIAIVPAGTASVDVTGVPTYEGASVTGDGTLTLVDGQVSTTIKVTSQDESSSNEYSLTIKEADGNNYALQLTGSNGQTSHVALNGTAMTLMPFTIEMWIKPEGDQSENAALFYNATNNIGLEFQGSNKLRFISNAGEGGDNGGSAISGELVPNVWHHVAVIVTDSTRTMYVDGEAVKESAGTGVFSTMDFSAEGLYLAWDANEDGNVYKGLMDEVRVWDNALSLDNIDDNKYEVLKGDEANLLAYYNFDVNSANNAFDASNGADHGTIVGGTYVASFSRANLELTALSIDGADMYPEFTKGITEYYAVLPLGASSVNVVANAASNSTTLSGNGNVAVSDSGTIVITATSGEYALDYKIKYVTNTALTLTHSYTFVDGTAKDVIGNANGMLYGEGYVEEGIYYADSLGSYISFPGDSIAINTYPALTLETFILDTEPVNPNANTMTVYLGGQNDWRGVDGVFFSAKDANTSSRTAISCLNYSSPWAAETGVNGPIVGEDGSSHHVVMVLDNDSLTLYMDGALVSSSALSDDNKVFNLSNEAAYLCKSGYSGDNTWLGGIFEFNIYKGKMDAATVALNYTTQMSGGGVLKDATTDATLSDLLYNDSTVEGFNPTYMEYTIMVPYGSTEVPTIAATAKVDGANATVTKAASLAEVTTIVVTSKDGNYSNTYSVSFEIAENPSDATLSSITVNGTSIENFDAATLNYSITVDAGTAVPTITATATNPKAWVTITKAATLSDTTFVVVMPEDSSATMTYAIAFEEAAALEQSQHSAISVFPTVSSGEFTVKTDGSLSTITVYSLSGTVVKQLVSNTSETYFTVDKAQMYLVSVANEQERQIFRIIKK